MIYFLVKCLFTCTSKGLVISGGFSPVASYTLIANSLRADSVRFAPNPRINPTVNNAGVIAPTRWERPVNIMAAGLVSTINSF